MNDLFGIPGILEILEAYKAVSQLPWFLFGQLTLAGLLAGSFCTTLIYRLPLMVQSMVPAADLSLTLPASHCPHCKNRIPFKHNIPLLGYLLAGGRCASCREPIATLYPLTEIACLFLALVCGAVWGATAQTATLLPLLWGLFALAIIDWRHGLLPDRITLTLLWLGLLVNSFGVWVPLQSAVWGATGGYLFLAAVNWCYGLLRKQEGLGGGDMKLLAALAAYFGWQALLPIVLTASLSGCFFAGLLFLFKRSRPRSLPWGPHLAFAGAIYPFVTAAFWNGWDFIAL